MSCIRESFLLWSAVQVTKIEWKRIDGHFNVSATVWNRLICFKGGLYEKWFRTFYTGCVPAIYFVGDMTRLPTRSLQKSLWCYECRPTDWTAPRCYQRDYRAFDNTSSLRLTPRPCSVCSVTSVCGNLTHMQPQLAMYIWIAKPLNLKARNLQVTRTSLDRRDRLCWDWIVKLYGFGIFCLYPGIVSFFPHWVWYFSFMQGSLLKRDS